MTAPAAPLARDDASPRPWVVYTGQQSAHGYGTSIDAIDGTSIAFVASSNTQADAALIIRAVNAHDDLVEALQYVETVMMIVRPRSHMREYLAALAQVRAALEKARAL